MIYDCARASTDDQDLALQREQLTAASCANVFSDTLRNTTSDRPEPKLAALTAGDDRIARGHAASKARGQKYGQNSKLMEMLSRKETDETIRAMDLATTSTTARFHA